MQELFSKIKSWTQEIQETEEMHSLQGEEQTRHDLEFWSL